jgi:hypothetical protein
MDSFKVSAWIILKKETDFKLIIIGSGILNPYFHTVAISGQK